jgi:SAM-dependent methyltransferase
MWWGEESWKGSTPAEYQLQPGKAEVVWSPYQKLTLIPLLKDGELVRYILNTNDSWFQQILDLSETAVSRHPELYQDQPIQFHRYNLPYRFYENPPEVLIAGAGMGNDVASALRNGAGHITAVEIDPLIVQEGQQLHFEKPYQSDRVDIVIDDARSFIQNTHKTYDLIVFSILDSHTTNSYYTNIRLDNYVYTVEAMQATRRLLKPGGILTLSFSSERPWFAAHLREVLIQAYGKEPLLFSADTSFFVIGEGDHVETVLAENPELRNFVEAHSDVKLEQADLITDDWPYLYQQNRGIPVVIWAFSIGLMGVSWLTFRRLNRSSEGIQWHFFFLGAAFLLLEVQIISKIALLFGTTWLVNSIVISVLLFFNLLSNVVVYRIPDFHRRYAYIGLFITILLGYLIPTNALFIESQVLRALAAASLYCSPAFFAGLVFISSFQKIGFRAEAFGSNLIGSLVGGLLESLSFWIGIRALVIVAALLYSLSWLTISRSPLKQSVIVDVEPS